MTTVIQNQIGPRNLSAFHEAGHATCAMALGFVVKSVNIHEVDGRSGRVEFFLNQIGADNSTLLREVLVSAAGLAAETLFYGKTNEQFPIDGTCDSTAGHLRDQAEASTILSKMNVDLDFKVCMGYAAMLLKEERLWQTVESIAECLIARNALDESEIIQFSVGVNLVNKDWVEGVEGAFRNCAHRNPPAASSN